MIPLATPVVTAASMLLECAINSHDGCWQCLHLTNILLLGYKEVRSQDAHPDGVWAPGTLINVTIGSSCLAHYADKCCSSIPRGDSARSDRKVHADLTEWTTAWIRRIILDGKYITTY